MAATNTDNDSKYVCINHFWRNVGSVVDMEGRPKCQKLVTKQHPKLHGNKTDEDTLNALGNVKDYLV